MSIAGPEAPVRFAAFAGPAPGRPDMEAALSAVSEGGVAFAVVLGDLGDDADAVDATLEALARLEMPVLVVPGGRDDATILSDRMEALEDGESERIIDVSGVDAVHVGGQTLLPVAGAPGGRYGRTADACGFTASDLEARAERIGGPEPETRRYLLSWAAPAGGVAEGIAGADAGDEALATFAEAVGARGGLHAWPREAAGLVVDDAGDRVEVLRRIAGPVAIRGDAARPPVGPSFFSIGPDGLSSP